MPTLQDSTLSSVAGSFYYCNLFINRYLEGKELNSFEQDYRGYYFQTGADLYDAITIIPSWYLIYEGDLWT